MLTDAGWFDWFLGSLWFPFVAGLLIQVSGTQWAKLYLPIRWDDVSRRGAVNGIAFLLGAIPTLAIMAGMGCDPYQFWLAIIVGVSGPMLYKAATALIYNRWPHLEGTLSAHGRARRKRNAQS